MKPTSIVVAQLVQKDVRLSKVVYRIRTAPQTAAIQQQRNAQSVHHCFDGAWIKIASDSAMVAYCTGLGYESSATLSGCESYCLSISGCNAVDWHPGKLQCTPRQCSYYPPKYASHSGWEVWAITTETSTTTNLVWVKVASESLMGDVNCAEVGSDESVTWSLCESACLALSSCNAIDFSYGGTRCTYRHCTTYPPNYQSASGWEVWAITTGTSTTTNTTIHVAE
ncbi:unnamed protein product [Adineta steineri]|uniref:Uncharacterized protein n=1 Tax=Adineta steineri TaxID=433720 RepID=A0A819Y8Z1_9BILA|nr:unnamed protein product [Adineta steineri]